MPLVQKEWQDMATHGNPTLHDLVKKALPAASLYVKLSLPPPWRTHAGPEDQRKIMQAKESSLKPCIY